MEKYDIESPHKTFCSLYVGQADFQRELIKSGVYGNVGNVVLPDDNTRLFSYHLLHMFSELGEVMEADERWKKYRDSGYSRECKLEEIADCFLTMMNIAIFSGYQSWEVEEAIVNKIVKNIERIKVINENDKKIKEMEKVAETWEIEEGQDEG